MYILRVRDSFDATHFLPWHEGKCRQLYGHRWEVEITITAKSLNENGIVVELPDHQFLNEGGYLLSLAERYPAHADAPGDIAEVVGNWVVNPTAENIADKLYDQIRRLLEVEGVMENVLDLSVRVWESPGSSIERVSE